MITTGPTTNLRSFPTRRSSDLSEELAVYQLHLLGKHTVKLVVAVHVPEPAIQSDLKGWVVRQPVQIDVVFVHDLPPCSARTERPTASRPAPEVCCWRRQRLARRARSTPPQRPARPVCAASVSPRPGRC